MQPTAPQPPADTAPVPFPDLLDAGTRMFWVAALLRDQAKLEAFRDKTMPLYLGKDKVLAIATTSAWHHLAQDVHESARNAQSCGVLLFAHRHTTALIGGAA